MDRRTNRSKKVKPRSDGPYDRQNQSIFGKVCSTVKGLLNPSWLFNNVSQWIGNVDEEPGCSNEIEETVRDDDDVVSQSLSHGNKRLRLRYDDHIPSIQNSGTQTWTDQPTTQNFNASVSSHVSSAPQSSLLDTTEALPVMNDVNCRSLWSSNFNPSTSNFNPSASNFNPSATYLSPSTSNFSPASHNFSPSTARYSSPSAKLQRRLPTISHTNQPNFNLSTFVGPSKLSQSVENKVSSPFYEGKTTFGGASASRRMPTSVAPYQVDKNLRNQIKVKENPSRDSLEGMSSAAKRILLTLEKMSSPVTDAKKIPNSSTSPVDLSLYLMPPKSRRNSQFTPSISKGPPIANINTIAKLATLKNYGVNRLRNTVSSSHTVPPEHKRTSLDIMQPSTSEVNIPKNGGGKMRNKLNQHHQSAKDTEDDMPEELPLPNIPLPISNLPKISFGPKPEVNRIPSSRGFTFSNPIEHEFSVSNGIPPSVNISSSQYESKLEKNTKIKPFVFSNPIEHDLPNTTLPKESTSLSVSGVTKSTAPLTSSSTTNTATWECSTCWVRNPSHKTSCMACETPQNSKKNSSGFKFGNEVKSQSPGSCLSVLFPGGVSKTSNAVTQNTSTQNFPFGSGSTSSTTTWECSSCLVRNAENASKCIACETLRTQKEVPTSKSSSLSIPSQSTCTTWKCDSCWIINPSDVSKCMSCEVARPTKESSSVQPSTVSNTLSTTVSSSPSTWKCSSCLVLNPIQEKKCLACETLHPDTNTAPGFKSSNGFKFSSPIQNSPITFKFGNLVSTVQSTVPISTFKFGTATSAKSDTTTATTVSSFKFGMPKTTESDLPATSSDINFDSGISTNSETPSSAFNFGTATESETPSIALKHLPSAPGLISSTETVSKSKTPMDALKHLPFIPGFAFDKETPSKSEINVDSTKPSVSSFALNKETTSISEPLLDASIQLPFAFSETASSKSETPSSDVKFGTMTTTGSDVTANKTLTFKFGTVAAAKSDALTTAPPNFKFGAATTAESDSSITIPGFKFVTATTKPETTTTASGFKFSTETATESNTTATNSELRQLQQSKFSSATSSKSETPTPTSGFKFVATTTAGSDTSNTTSDFKFGAIAKSETASGFKFSTTPISTSNNSIFGTTASIATSKTSETSLVPTSTTGFKIPTSVNSVDPALMTTTSGFSFGSTTTFGLVAKPKTTDISGLTSGSLQHSILKTGDAKSITSTPFSTTTNSTSGFGNTMAITSAPSNFSFFPASSATPASSVFTFGASSTTAQSTKQSGFTFKSVPDPQNTPALPSTSQTAAQGLNMVASTAPTGGFVFGAPKTEAQSAASTPFVFGSSSTSTSNASAFSAFQPTQPTNQVFQFGNQPATNAVTPFGSSTNFQFAKNETLQISSSTTQNATPAFGASAGNFAFGSKTEAPSQVSSTTSQAPMAFGSTSSTFSFGNKNENVAPQNSTPAFGTGQVSSVFGSAPVPSFGASDKPSSGNFTFGTPSSGVFQFGASSTDKKQAAPSSGFAFGTPSAPETNNTFASGFAINTPPSFNFGATSTPTAPFQFAASSSENTGNPSMQRKIKRGVRRVLRRD